MIHFQLGDRDHLENGQIIASPAGYISASGKALLDELWRTSAYRAELCEPFLTNSRAHSLPISRSWTRQSGNGPSTIELTCARGTAARLARWRVDLHERALRPQLGL